MAEPRELPDRTSTAYCIVCEYSHIPPVAVAINDRCPANGHTHDCLNAAFVFHAATGGDLECVCGALDEGTR